jgi:hypothetical protein
MIMVHMKCQCGWTQAFEQGQDIDICPRCKREYRPMPEFDAVTVWEPQEPSEDREGIGWNGQSPWRERRRLLLRNSLGYCGGILSIGFQDGKEGQVLALPWMIESVNSDEFVMEDAKPKREGEALLYLPFGGLGATLCDCGPPSSPYGQVMPYMIPMANGLVVTNLFVSWRKD